MTIKTLCISIATISLLAACGDKDAAGDANGKMSAAQAEKMIKDAETMSPPELMKTAGGYAENIAQILEGVNDEASAKKAAEQIREMAPQFKALMTRLENMDESDMKMNMSLIRATADFGKSQMGLIEEISRISKDHPELRDTLSHALDEIEF